MAEILICGATEILNKLADVVAQQIGLAWGVKDDLKKLQRTLQMILAVISDAQTKQVREEAVRLWLRWLKDVAYDAEDVMDEFSYETMRRYERGNRLKNKVCEYFSSSNPLAFRFRMARKIKEINSSLDEITKTMHGFQLQITTPSNAITAYGETSEQQSRHTTSLPGESKIVGRQDDKNQLINILRNVIPPSTTSSDRYLEKVSVISLVGMGGLGKTTLAQLVYNDELVQKEFDLAMWVYVSENFDVENLLIQIMESTNLKGDNISNFDVLAKKVQEQLNEKKYLLVLDDMWSEDEEQWDRLKSVLLVGAQGSKILITTRKDQVASIVRGSIPPYNLMPLPAEACWSMMEQKAFSYGGAQNTHIMTKIGKEIAHKCSGLPLAAKFLGSILHKNNKESDWISVKDSEIWNTPESQKRVLEILKLSYNNLSFHLKQCFSYCSIFPKNWVIEKETLIQLWLAEGFLTQPNAHTIKSIEDFGNEYFENLVWSSFFQYFEKDDLGFIKTYKMHGLVHDLAKAVLGDNELVSVLHISELKNVSEARRLKLTLDGNLSASSMKALSRNAKKLRTVFVPTGSKLDPVIFSGNNPLRVLHLGLSPQLPLPKLPHLSFKLKYLRYLHLSCLSLKEVVNDQAINKLYNLETLVLKYMQGVQNFLGNIQSLKKLRHLEISYTDLEELPDSFASLCHLQTLNLNHSGLKALPDSVTGWKFLRFLDLSFTLIEKLPDFIGTLSNLQTLNVSSCKNLRALPEYVKGLDKIIIFHFVNCPLLQALPNDFGALTHLRNLNLSGTDVKVLPDSCANLNNLEYVQLDSCEIPKEAGSWTKLRKFFHFKEITTQMSIRKLVCLEEMTYHVRKNDFSSPESNDGGIEELGNLNLLQKLIIWELQNVKNSIDAKRANMEGKQNLSLLGLHWGRTEGLDKMKFGQRLWNDLQVLKALQPHTGLKNLVICNYIGLEFPTWMCTPSCLPNLESVYLGCCRVMKQLPTGIGQLPRLRDFDLRGMCLKCLNIGGFPSLVNLTLTDMFLLEDVCSSHPNLQRMIITGCKRLSEIPSFPSLKTMVLRAVDNKLVSSIGRSQTSLTELTLENVDGLISFPISILRNNCNLQGLRIRLCNEFEGFQVNNDETKNEAALFGSQLQIDSLLVMELLECAALKVLPDLQGCVNLRRLTIFGCPQVKMSLSYDLKSISSLKVLKVDFIQRDEQKGDPSAPEELINLLG